MTKLKRGKDMLPIVGLLVIINALIITAWWVTGDNPNKKSALTICGLAIVTGFLLIIHDRITELTSPYLGTIKTAAKQASADADAISDIKNRIEAQSSTIDAVAEYAGKAHAQIKNLVTVHRNFS